MKQTFLVFLFISLSILTTKAQNIDSLKQALTYAKEDTNKAFILYMLYFDYKNVYPDSALPYIQELYQLSNNIKYDAGIRYALLELGDMSQTFNNDKQALQYDSMALPLFAKMKDTLGLYFTLTHIGNIYSGLHDYKNSLLYYHKAFNILNSFHDTTQQIINFYAGISGIYEQNNQLDSALYFAKKAVQLNPDNGYGLQKMAVAYVRLDNDDLALEFYKKSLLPTLRNNARGDLENIYNGMAGIYKKRGDIDSAILNAQKALFYDSASLNATEMLVDIYDSLHNKDSTLKYLKLTTALKENLFTNEQNKLRFLENITYNEGLKNKDAEAAHVRSQNNMRLMFLLAGLFAVITIAIILVRNNRHKEKANVLLQAQKQKVESALSKLTSTQQQLIQSEKMASLGELTAGIAHEIQNPLNFVNNFSEVNTELLSEMREAITNQNFAAVDQMAKDIQNNEQKINHHGKRADAIVKGMLQHSRARTSVRELTDINVLADEYLRLAYHGLRAKDKNFNATMKTKFDDSVGKINIIPQDIGRVLLNLYNNAFYSVNEKKTAANDHYHPEVEIETRKEGNQVSISVCDNGKGIPQKIVDKIFQPFFTTKPTGQGTGLGLSLAYDIVKAHGGEIKVISTEGDGSEFIIELPLG